MGVSSTTTFGEDATAGLTLDQFDSDSSLPKYS